MSCGVGNAGGELRWKLAPYPGRGPRSRKVRARQRRRTMQQNRVKKILREGGLALGTHVGGIPDPQIVELIGLAGFDAAFIDMEHTTFDLHDVQAMVMAAERVGVTP